MDAVERERRRQDEVEKSTQKIKRKHELQWAAEDFLGAGPEMEFDLLVCEHEACSSKPAAHISAMLRVHTAFYDMRPADAVRLIRGYLERGIILTAPRWKEASFLPCWAPEDCNYSINKPGAEKVDDKQVKLEVSGGVGYLTNYLSFWTRLPNQEAIPAAVSMRVTHLPVQWTPVPSYRWSECAGEQVVVLRRPDNFAAHYQVGAGSRSSWRMTKFWDTADDFLRDILRAGLPS